MPAEAFARHDLVAAAPAAWDALLAGRRDLDGVPHLPGWAKAGRPLIVRRRVPGEGDDLVPLGLPLPPPTASAGSASPCRRKPCGR